MADSGAIRAGRAFVEIGGDNNPLVKALRDSEARIKAFGAFFSKIGKTMMTASAALLAPLAAATKIFTSWGSQLAEASLRTGIAVERLSEFAYAAKMGGIDIETMEGGIRKMQKALTAASQGSSEAVENLDRLGLSVSDLIGLSPDQQFKMIGQALSDMTDPTLRAGAAITVFGRSGTALLPMLEGGAKGLAAFQAKARALGLTVSGELAAKAHELHQAFETIWFSIKAGSMAIGSALQPTLQSLSQQLIEIGTSVGKWLRHNQDTIVMAAKLVVGVGALGVAFYAIGKVITLVSAATGVLAAGLKVLVVVCGALKVAMLALAANPALTWGLWVGAAVAALGTALALRALTSETKELSFAARELLEVQDAMRTEDESRMGRLLVLARKEELTKAQMKEAKSLIGELTGRYGNLGVAVDELANRLTGATEAQEKMNAAMRAMAEQETLAAIKEMQAESESIASKISGPGWAAARAVAGDLPLVLKQVKIPG